MSERVKLYLELNKEQRWAAHYGVQVRADELAILMRTLLRRMSAEEMIEAANEIEKANHLQPA